VIFPQICKRRQPTIINGYPAAIADSHNNRNSDKPFRWNPTALAAEFDVMGSVKVSFFLPFFSLLSLSFSLSLFLSFSISYNTTT